MGSRDRQVRQQYVTFRGKIAGQNYTDRTETDMTAGMYTSGLGGYSDVAVMQGYNPSTGAVGNPAPAAQNVIRILQPHWGQLEEAYLDFQVTGATNDGTSLIDHVLSVKFAIGYFNTYGIGAFNQIDDVSSPILSYPQSRIDFYHQLMTGTTNAFTSSALQVTALKVNLLPALQYYYNNEKNLTTPQTDACFPLIISFGGLAPTATGTAGNFMLNMLKVTLATRGIL